ncbi:DNA polymerase-3 subunit epsilon [Dinghuibacter silviterrae]|uniref:DNA polymerase-3 subunit epsilon n=1 Tax=Dinghuibacter silviterrae TaxID=1539049 RepID=A0A4R8DH51_9BACT|nr:DNA polymerase-3 subunit epsilon [Dinghuibacter silviterrae]
MLFIDTEATGLPLNWELPYSTPGNWPHAIQVSWLVYSREGVKIKEEDHYIHEPGITISPDAARIHRLRRDFLQINGKRRASVLQLLEADLARYEPLLVGHFLNLDLHVLRAEYFREGMSDPTRQLPTYCTMLGSKHLQPNPSLRYLKLGDLCETLFGRAQQHPHDAYWDARTTADCYFELERRGQIQTL